jgi:hypothetical protein
VGILRSERFTDDPMLEAAAKNQPPLEKGCTGEGVAALQIALLDLGYSLPISTANGAKQPDGIFGNETDGAVRAFQADQKLAVDGDVGTNTMRALDEECIYNDLRPALYYASMIDAAAMVARNKPIETTMVAAASKPKWMNPDLSDSLHSLSRQLHLALIDKLPESKREEAREEWYRKDRAYSDKRFFRFSTARLRDLPTLKRGETIAMGGSPAAVVAMMGALLLSAVLQNPEARNSLKPKSSASPLPTPDPRLEFLSFALTSVTAVAVQASIRRHQDAIKKCQEKNAHRIPGCTQALLKFAEATNELRKCATVAQHSGGQFRFPGFVARVAKALSAYNEALKELAKCLACGPLGPLSI